MNRRDYPGSTPFSDEDILLTAPGSPPEDSDIFLRARAFEFAHFLAWFVREHDIPPIGGQREGGLSIVAWSSSNTIIMSLMANLARLPDDLRDGLEPYIRSYIHYGAVKHVTWRMRLTHPRQTALAGRSAILILSTSRSLIH